MPYACVSIVCVSVFLFCRFYCWCLCVVEQLTDILEYFEGESDFTTGDDRFMNHIFHIHKALKSTFVDNKTTKIQNTHTYISAGQQLKFLIHDFSAIKHSVTGKCFFHSSIPFI